MNRPYIDKIGKEIETLPPEEQLELVERLIHGIRDEYPSKELNWEGLYGLGTGLWPIDAQEYVNQIRGNQNSSHR